ncbi:hypothetical protein [Haloarcula montana]|uniref:hypothetical protein n=1 Tax=Haloarcula montana TaxID=3111776 RepID=UPI002D766A7C|nr:hypothetical protein [Haloarcula sp. GH36]
MTATVVEPMGNQNVVHLAFPGETEGTEDLVATTDGRQRIESGATVTAHVPVEAIHVFDAESGDALYTRDMAFAEQEPML